MTLTVTVVAFLIHLYSRGYMEHEGGYYRFFTYLNFFLFMMLTLVTAANYPLMFVGWEGVGLCSYLLIGFYFRKKSAADAGKKAFIVTRIGDAGFTVGVALLFWTFHSLDFRADFWAASPFCRRAPWVAYCTAGGAPSLCGRGRQVRPIPLYVWLPDAMEGPTPVSALIHAATMVTAGVYLVARSQPPLRPRSARAGRRRRHRLRDGAFRRDHCPDAERHEAHARLFHHQPTRVHVPRLRRGVFAARHFPLDDARVLQVTALPRRRQRDARHGRRTRHAEDGRPAAQIENDVRHVPRRHAGHQRRSRLCWFLQQGRDPGGSL